MKIAPFRERQGQAIGRENAADGPKIKTNKLRIEIVTKKKERTRNAREKTNKPKLEESDTLP